jgi:hypothetical protein
MGEGAASGVSGATLTHKLHHRDDLFGARAAGALSDLESRGFRFVDRFQSDSDRAGMVWWNGRSRQCVQLITVDGHIDSFTDIGNHPRCR